MKRLILILIACLLIPLNAYAFNAAIQAVLSTGYVASCTTANDSALITQGTNSSNTNIYTYYVAAPITVTSGTTITEFIVQLRDTTATGNTTTCGIYTVSGSTPGTLVTGTQVTSNFSTNAWTEVTFTLSSPVTLAGTNYFVKCHAASANMLWGRTSESGSYYDAADDATWGAASTGTLALKVYGCAP